MWEMQEQCYELEIIFPIYIFFNLKFLIFIL